MPIKKRYRVRIAKPGRLEAYFGKSEDGDIDIVYSHGGGGASRSDARLLCHFFEVLKYKLFEDDLSLLGHLKQRGYDVTTLRFSIEQSIPPQPRNPGDAA